MRGRKRLHFGGDGGREFRRARTAFRGKKLRFFKVYLFGCRFPEAQRIQVRAFFDFGNPPLGVIPQLEKFVGRAVKLSGNAPVGV